MPISPNELRAEHFAKYPPEARKLATSYLSLFKELPLSFLPLLLREVIQYDWKFPIERQDLDRQLSYLQSLPDNDRRRILADFAVLKLSPNLAQMDWTGSPARFSEQLTAFLWTSRQIDSFRSAALAYVAKLDGATPHEALSVPRLTIVLIGQGVSDNQRPLFRKLLPHGVYFKQVDPRDGLQSVLETVVRRAREHPSPFAHWYIDGSSAESLPNV
jgi:hypothetical protein